MKNNMPEEDRLKKTSAVILTIVAVVALAAIPFIVASQNASAAIFVRHGGTSYHGHHYARTCVRHNGHVVCRSHGH